MKKLYFCRTNCYDMIVSVDNENNARYLTETEEFPYMATEEEALHFLETAVEDDSSWETDLSPDEIFVDGVDIIAEIEKEII